MAWRSGSKASKPADRDKEPGVVQGDESKAAFVERFKSAWREGAQGLIDFEGVVAADVLLTQPLTPAVRGLEAFRAQFKSLFDVMPDLRGEVLSWGASSDGVLIDLELRGTLSGRKVKLNSCDRIVLRDGLMSERHARFDPLPLVGAVALSPSAALALMRARRAGARRGR
ncbi:MAG TPA: nuclear transport factor 2 family protein [Solirubrobacteraceae bacterium]|nr:nuclear transport factor 2 family protein [Solirubrobacteraceae bacterium]